MVKDGQLMGIVSKRSEIVVINSDLFIVHSDDDMSSNLYYGQHLVYSDNSLEAAPISKHGMQDETRYWAKIFQNEIDFYNIPLELWNMIASFI